MGTVVTLPPRRPSRATVDRTDEATILLFMGVRYVRDIEPIVTGESTDADLDIATDDELPPLEIA